MTKGNYETCSKCGYDYSYLNLYGYDGQLICKSCFPENHKYCYNCNSVFENNYFIEVNDKDTCINCARAIKNSLDEFIHSSDKMCV